MMRGGSSVHRAELVSARGATARFTARGVAVCVTGLALLFSSASPVPLAAQSAPIVVASKPFAESYLLAELFAQLLESQGIAVTRRPGLGATEIAFRALQEGAIDLYPEYTGTGLRVLLADSTDGLPADETWRRVADQSWRRWDVQWLPPLGFENGYAIAVTAATRQRLGDATLSALGRNGGMLRAGLTADFLGRADGLPRLRSRARWSPATVRPLAPALKYTALATGAVDVIDAYATDGRLAASGLEVLADDVGAFPSYAACVVVGPRVARSRPDVVALLTKLSGRLTTAQMRDWNRRIEVNGESPAQVAASALREIGLMEGAAPARRDARRAPIAAAWAQRGTLPGHLGRHLLLVAIALGAALLIGGGLGAALGLTHRSPEPVLRVLGAVQTIPALALLALAIPWLGVGLGPALLALWLYALYPIVQSTSTALRQVDPRLLETGRALGLTPWQCVRDIRLPLALPSILAGVRTATVLTIGGATLAAFVGAGGLGEPIAAGLALGDDGLVLLGAVPAAALALVADAALGALARRLTPAHLNAVSSEP